MAHTYQSTYAALREARESLPSHEQREVMYAECEALGYARGRMDAREDYNQPRAFPIEPNIFAWLYALHVIKHITANTMRNDIRSFWESYVLNEV